MDVDGYEKQEVLQVLEELPYDFFIGYVDEVLLKINDLQRKHYEYWDFELCTDHYCYDCCNPESVQFCGKRMETDEEFQRRVKRSHAAKEAAARRKKTNAEKKEKEMQQELERAVALLKKHPELREKLIG